jgi:flagellar biosynthetic protein FlhB
MAENDTDQQERTERPSAKRLDDARARGQVPRSRELATTLVVLSGAAVLWGGQAHFVEGLEGLFALGLKVPRSVALDENAMATALGDALVLALELLAPLFLVVCGAAVVAALALGGFVFSFDALTPKLAKLNPIAGLKRIFGWNGLAELVKALAKVLIVGLVAAWLLRALTDDFMSLSTLTLHAGLERAAWLTTMCFIGLAASLALIAAADVPFQHWQHQHKLKMTRQETRDEQKETEGRPEVRSRIRNLQRAFATRRMMADVPKADVVVMNPTHFAVALRYDAKTMKAPRVLAKGADMIALNIRRIAQAHKVPVFEHREFARALYYTSDVGKEISPRLYVAVAQVLTYVYQLTGRAAPGSAARSRNVKAPRKPELAIDPQLLDPALRRAARGKA